MDDYILLESMTFHDDDHHAYCYVDVAKVKKRVLTIINLNLID